MVKLLGRLTHRKDDFTEMLAVLQHLLGASCLPQRQHFVHDWPQPSCRDVLEHAQQLVFRTIYEPKIDTSFAKRWRRSSFTSNPVVAPQVTRRPPRARQLTLSCQVAAPACSKTTSTPRLPVSERHFVADLLLRVVDDVVGAERARLFQLNFAAGGGDDAGVEELRDLDGGTAHAAAAPITRTSSPGRNEHLVTSMCQAVMNTSGSRRIRERQVAGVGERVNRRHFDQVGVAAVGEVAEGAVILQ